MTTGSSSVKTKRLTSTAQSLFRRKRKWLILLFVCLIILPLALNFWVKAVGKDRIISDAEQAPHHKVALVLGAGVLPDGTLSTVLKDRVDKAIELYNLGKVDKLLMSGDNRFSHYNEPQRMKDYAVAKGVPPEDVAMDFAGRRTYDSVYRAKHIFGQDRLIVVSQEFHLYRSLFLCEKLGIDAYGVPGDYPGTTQSIIREIPARINAVLDIYILHPTPILGEKEDI